MKEHKLKQGDHVVMHTCMEHDSPDNFGKIWTCRSDEFRHKGHDYGSIFLDGFSGSFSTEFLQKVNIEDLLTEKDATIKKLQQQIEAVNKELAEGPQPFTTADEYRVWLYSVLPFLNESLGEGEEG